MGAAVTPLRSTDSIMWTVKFRNGMLKRFKFPIRTTVEGQAVPDGGFETKASLNDHVLFTEPASARLPEIFTLKK
jgi:adenylylsulfate reductase subunit B